MKTIVVGDLHGRINIFQDILKLEYDRLVLVGDYLDSFNEPIENQIELLDLVLHLAKTDGRVTALIGNHELSYIDNRKYGASGWNRLTQFAINGRLEDILSLLSKWTSVDSYLITHAGVSCDWLINQPEFMDSSCKDTTLQKIEQYLDYCELERLAQVGLCRGGSYYCGGPFWCNWHKEFVPIKNINQICGHTERRPNGIYEGLLSNNISNSHNYMVDCLTTKRQVLSIIDGKVTYENF